MIQESGSKLKPDAGSRIVMQVYILTVVMQALTWKEMKWQPLNSSARAADGCEVCGCTTFEGKRSSAVKEDAI